MLPLRSSYGAIESDHADEFVVGLEEFPDSLDPRAISYSQVEHSLEHLAFLPLYSASVTGLPQQVLVDSARFSGPLTLELKLRSGIRFANGREINADDVVATYRYIMGNDVGQRSPRRALYSNIFSVSSRSSHVVQVVLKLPDAGVLSRLTVGILPKEAFDIERSRSKFADGLIGVGAESGPFIVSKFSEREIIFSRNSRYTGAPYGGSLPALKRLRFKLYGSRQAIYDALVAGELDLVQNSLDHFQLSELRAKHSTRFQVQTVIADETWYLGFNFRKKMFSDSRVRRAIAHTVDRTEILRFSLLGMGVEAHSVFPPRNFFYPVRREKLSSAPSEARTLLNSSGVEQLKNLSESPSERPASRHFNISVPMNKDRIAVAKAVAGQLRTVGLNVGVDVSDYRSFLEKLTSGEADAWIAPWSGFRDGDFLRLAFHSNSRPPVGSNTGIYSNKELDSILEKALLIQNQTQRKEIYDRAQEIISKDLPYVPLWHSMNFAVISRRFRGFEIFPDGRLATLSSVRKK